MSTKGNKEHSTTPASSGKKNEKSRAAARPAMQLYVPKHRRAAVAAETAKEAGIDDSSPRHDVSRSTDKTDESTVHVNRPLDTSSRQSLKASSAPAPTVASNESPKQNVDMTLYDSVDSVVSADAVRSRPYRVGLPSPTTVSYLRSDFDDSTVTANDSTDSADTTLMSKGADRSTCVTADPGAIHDSKLAMNLASTAPLAISDMYRSEQIETSLPTGTIACSGAAHSDESTVEDNPHSSVLQENDVASSPTYLPGVNDIAVINSNVDSALAAGDAVRAVEEFLLQSQEKDQSLTNNAEDKDNSGGTEQQTSKSSAEQPAAAVSSSMGKTAATPATVSSATSVAEDGSDSWETLYDDLDDSLPEDSVKEVTKQLGNVKVEKAKCTYLNYEPKDPDISYEEFGHLIEIYDFPASLQTQDLLVAFLSFKERGFEVQWVDETHAIGVFSSSIAAQSALELQHPLIKVRPISEATRPSKVKAKRLCEHLQPVRPRPDMNASVARNLVANALGLTNRVSKVKVAEDRKKLKEARDKKKTAERQKNDAWEGNF